MPDEKSFEIARKKLEKAGKIAAQALDYSCKLIKPGQPLIFIAEQGEQQLRKLGAKPAFPINISINHHAAHYTPSLDDTRVIPDQSLVKVDLGAHIDGYIADNARTVIIGDDPKLKQLRDAADAGLEAAIKTIRAGIRVWEISKAISKAMRRAGARPIENLTGHSIDVFNLHAGVSIPAVAQSSDRMLSPRLKEHMVIAIEPFSTFSSKPRVIDLEAGHIFGFVHGRNPSTKAFRELFSLMKVKFALLPFASRWLKELVSVDQIPVTLNALRKKGCIHNYPVLGLPNESPIAQSEHTVIVEQKGCSVTTLLPNIR